MLDLMGLILVYIFGLGFGVSIGAEGIDTYCVFVRVFINILFVSFIGKTYVHGGVDIDSNIGVGFDVCIDLDIGVYFGVGFGEYWFDIGVHFWFRFRCLYW
eukprot:315053_1